MTNTTETELTETGRKINALAEYIDVGPEDINESTYNDIIFDSDGDEYLVLTDEEANERTGEYIMNSLWAFNAEFIIEHTKLPDEAIDMIKTFCADKCEDANDTIESLIIDMDEFIYDAICADGRAHFINSYNGEEYETSGFYIYRV